MEPFLSATEQAELVRQGEVAPRRAGRALPRAHRAPRPRAERVRHRLRGRRWREPARRAVPRRAAPDQGPERDRGGPHDVSSRAFADYVPDFDAAVVRRLKDAGFVVLGKTNTPRARDHRRHRVRAERRLPQPVGHAAHAGRVERRRGGCGGGGHGAGAPRAATAAARSASRRRAAGCSGSSRRAAASRRRRTAASRASRRAARSTRTVARRGRAARRDGRLRARRPVVGAAAGAAVRRRGRPRSRAGCAWR